MKYTINNSVVTIKIPESQLHDLVHRSHQTIEISADEIRKIVEEHPEILEKKTYKRWRAEEGQRYYHSGPGLTSWSQEARDEFDDYRYNIGNYFRTVGEAYAYRDRQLAIQRVTDAINEANEGWVPDWIDGYQNKSYIFYEHDRSCFSTTAAVTYQGAHLLPYARSERILKEIIEKYDKELRLIWGIK